MSKNFYEYKFNEEGNFYQDLIYLHGNIKVDNLLSGNTDSEEIKVFLRKYPKEEYGKEYDILETGYKGKKISEIRQQENDSFPESAKYQLIKKLLIMERFMLMIEIVFWMQWMFRYVRIVI